MRNDKQQKILNFIFLGLWTITVILFIYFLWNIATSKVSAEIDCEATDINYDNTSCYYKNWENNPYFEDLNDASMDLCGKEFIVNPMNKDNTTAYLDCRKTLEKALNKYTYDCIKPKNIKCHVLVNDFPITRAIIEGLK